jgi:hypothetical protein
MPVRSAERIRAALVQTDETRTDERRTITLAVGYGESDRDARDALTADALDEYAGLLATRARLRHELEAFDTKIDAMRVALSGLEVS